jgi:hypothetical protein
VTRLQKVGIKEPEGVAVGMQRMGKQFPVTRNIRATVEESCFL